jgi:hypothetical protein
MHQVRKSGLDSPDNGGNDQMQCVDLEPRPLAVVGIEAAGVTAEACCLEELALGR